MHAVTATGGHALLVRLNPAAIVVIYCGWNLLAQTN
jgi:hypothetical protein